MPEPLSASEVVQVCKGLQDQPGFSDWRTVTQTRHDLRHRHQAVGVKGISQLLEDRSPAIEVQGQRFVNDLDAADIQINVAARSTDPAAVAAAQRVENFNYAFYYDLKRRRTNRVYAADRRALDQMAFYGCGVPKLDFADDEIKGQLKDLDALRKVIGEEGFTSNPFVLECPDLQSSFWEPDLSTMCEVGEKTVSQLHKLYEDDQEVRDWLTSDTMEEGNSVWQETVQVYHLETPDYIYDVIGHGSFTGTASEALELSFRPNVAGRPWYSLIPGTITSENSPRERFLPLIHAVYPLIQMLNILDTLLMSGALQTGRPMWQEVKKGANRGDFSDLIMGTSNEQGEVPTVRFDPTRETLPKPASGHEWVVVPVPSQEHLISLRNLKKQELQEYGFPAPLDPSQPLEGKSGYDTVAKMEMASRTLKPALENIAASWYERFKLVADIIQNLGVKITIPVQPEGRGTSPQEMITIRPEDFREHDLIVSFKSSSNAAEAALRESDIRMVKEGFMSVPTLMAKHHDDPIAEQERIFTGNLEQITIQQATETLQQLIQAHSQQIAAQALAEVNAPLPQAPEGGPAPGQDIRQARPEVPIPGVGAPLVNPAQSQDGVTNPNEGLQSVVTAQ